MNKEKMNLIFVGNLLETLFVCFASSSIEYMSLFFGFSKKILFRNMLGIIFIGIIIYLVYILLNYLKYKKIKENNLIQNLKNQVYFGIIISIYSF